MYSLLFPLTSEFALNNECEVIVYTYCKNSHHLSLTMASSFSYMNRNGNFFPPTVKKTLGLFVKHSSP